MRYFIIVGDSDKGIFSSCFTADTYPNRNKVEAQLKLGEIYITNIIELNKKDYESYIEGSRNV